MIVYKGVISGDEMFTDAHPLKTMGPFVAVTGALVTRSLKGEEYNTGANPSQEEEQEHCDTEGAVQSGVNVCLDCKYQEAQVGSYEEYRREFKEYVKKVLKKLQEKDASPEAIDKFKSTAMEAIKDLKTKFDDCTFYRGESFNMDEYLIPCYYEGETPTLLFLEEGLIKEKY